MKVLTVYLAYLWVGFLHAFFIGASLYMCFGKKLIQWKFWQVALLFFPMLLFFEVYWIPMFNYLGLEIFIQASEVHEYFGIDGKTNMVNTLRPRVFNWIFLVVQATFAVWVGKKLFNRNLRK